MPDPSRLRRWSKRAAIGLALLVLAAQALPFGRAHTNPPVTGEPAWDSARTREIFARACGDCHSHATRWPWYSHVAPASWLLARDVDEGREHFDVSAWDRSQRNGDEAAEELEGGEMPPWFYLPLHPAARLSDAERAELVAGLRATFGGEGGERRARRDD